MRWWQFRKRDDDLQRELQCDLELEEEEQQENGLPAEEAHYAARRALGNTSLIREQTHEVWGWSGFEHLWQDVRYASRQLKRHPGFTAVVVLVLGVGIGANCAVFSFVDAIFLRPLPVPHPDRLVRIYARGPSGHYGAGFSYPEFEYLRDFREGDEFRDICWTATARRGKPVTRVHRAERFIEQHERWFAGQRPRNLAAPPFAAR